MLSERERVALVDAANDAAAVHDADVTVVYHFSEDGMLRRFTPHVPPTNPSHPPAVWAIDAAHAPLYWFPRHCPRVSVWARDDEQQAVLRDMFGSEATRVCAAETGWFDRVRTTRLYRYEFDASAFIPWAIADGQYVSSEPVKAERVEALDDLLALHVAADVELRFTPRLGALVDQVLASGLPFSFVRIRDARR